MLKMQMLEQIYTPNMIKAKRYYLGYLRKHDIDNAYNMMMVSSRTQARNYLDVAIFNNKVNKLKRMDLSKLKGC